MSTVRWTMPTIRRGVAKVAAGASFHQVAREIGASHTTVADWCARYGVSSTAVSGRRSRVPLETRRAAVALVDAGVSMREAARRVGCSRHQIHGWRAEVRAAA